MGRFNGFWCKLATIEQLDPPQKYQDKQTNRLTLTNMFGGWLVAILMLASYSAGTLPIVAEPC